MTTLRALRTRIAFAVAVTAVCGCATANPYFPEKSNSPDPLPLVGGFFHLTNDAAIVIGRTFFDIIGWGIVVTPEKPTFPPYPPPIPSEFAAVLGSGPPLRR